MKYSEDQLDAIMSQIIGEAAAGDNLLDEIADSPQLWWGVQRATAGERPARKRGWITTFDWRIAAFASLAFGALLIGVFVSDRTQESLNIASNGVDGGVITIGRLPGKRISPIAAPVMSRQKDIAAKPARTMVRDRIAPKKAKEPVPTTEAISNSEVRSEFIALMYAPDSDSGQVVKVKVPRSMMVSLGVSTNVGNTAEYVNAEVLVGDDGSARAIRFIQ